MEREKKNCSLKGPCLFQVLRSQGRGEETHKVKKREWTRTSGGVRSLAVVYARASLFQRRDGGSTVLNKNPYRTRGKTEAWISACLWWVNL